MRQSQFYAPTLRTVKADNQGHALLLRGAYIRQLGAGIYSYLPLGARVLRNIEAVVRQEMDAAGAIEILMPAIHPIELLGAHPGSLGAVGLEKTWIIADEALRGRTHMTTGANEDGFHLRGVNIERDIKVTKWADVREAREGELSPKGGGPLESAKCIEMGHVFKLGSKYSKAMGATYLDQNGKKQTPEMGCYGIGVSRIMAAVVEAHHDERGPIWPAELAPYDVHLLLLERDEAVVNIAEALYAELQAAGLNVLYDDRAERPGSKFADADLFGVPIRIMAGRTTKESGELEVRTRADKDAETVEQSEVVAGVRAMLAK